jgi:hypothetical protein
VIAATITLDTYDCIETDNKTSVKSSVFLRETAARRARFSARAQYRSHRVMCDIPILGYGNCVLGDGLRDQQMIERAAVSAICLTSARSLPIRVFMMLSHRRDRPFRAWRR